MSRPTASNSPTRGHFRRRAVAIAATLALVAIAVVIGVAESDGASTSNQSHVLASTKPDAATPGVKSQLTGLIDKSSQYSYTHGQPFPPANLGEVQQDYAAFSGIVVNASWAQLEPTHGNFDFGVLRTSLARITGYNRSHPRHPLRVKLRVFGGFGAPQWAKTIDGSPIHVPTKILADGAGTLGQWWKPDYRTAWSDLQHALATQFDTNKLVAAVAVSSCATLTAEPFVLNLTPPVRQQMVNDGWSPTEQQNCLDGAFSDYLGWKRTPIDYTFNPLPSVNAGSTSPHPDMTYTQEVMSRCANLFADAGRACVVENHALSQNAQTTSGSAPVYSAINKIFKSHHGTTAVGFQTLTHNQWGGCQAIAIAVSHHALSVELWPPTSNFKGYAAYPANTLIQWAGDLKDGTVPKC